MLEAGLAAFKLGGAIGSLFKKKKKAPTPRDNIMSQAQGARDAAEKYGFNPLTMLQYGQPGGAMGVADGGAPPLASIHLISGALQDVNDIVSGDAARRRAADQLELDLAKVKIDQAKSQIALDNARLGQMLSEATFGRRAAVKASPGGAAFSDGRLSITARPPVHPFKRPVEMIPVRGPDGVPRKIPKDFAEKLDIKPFGTIMMGDMEELRGDTMGEVTMAPHIPDVLTFETQGVPAKPAFEIQYDGSAQQWVPPFTDPKSESWWKRPLWGNGKGK